MSSGEKRLDDIIKALSPEDKARLAIEDLFREKPVLSPANCRRMLAEMSPEEGRRYNAVVERHETLKGNVRMLSHLAEGAKKQLLMRDRILWFYRALVEVEEAIIFDPDVAGPLLVENTNLKLGRPLTLRVLFADVSLGVWGRKQRLPVRNASGVRLNERVIEALGMHTGRIRQIAGEMKALHRYMVEESRALELEYIEGFCSMVVRQVSDHDRPLLQEMGKTVEQGHHRDGLFPVDDRWALVWEEVEEDAETARRVRADPEGWVAVSHDEEWHDLRGRFLDIMKDEARRVRE
jgi:hypothetical protein